MGASSVLRSVLRRRWVLPLAVAPVLLGCACAAPFTDDANLESVVWMDDGWVYAVDGEYGHGTPLMRLKADVEPEVVSFASADCQAPHISALARISRNVLGVAASCAYEQGWHLFAFDLSTQAIERAGTVVDRPDDMTWADGGDVGYVAGSWPLCRGIALVANGEAAPFNEPVSLEGAQWRLDQTYAMSYPADETCWDAGDAQSPAVSGSEVFFAASGAARGIVGTYDRWSTATAVVRMAVPEGPVELVADGFSKVRDVAVSPDGLVVAVAAERDGVESCWIVDVNTGNVEKLDVPWTEAVAFSPTGRDLVIATVGGDAIFQPLYG